MTHDDNNERPVDRRLLLRGGAVLAGAAGATVVGAALGPASAHAADGATLLSGKANASENTTTLTIDGLVGGPTPALSLVNANGPSLRISTVPEDFATVLKVGELAGSDFGPLVGVDYGVKPETTFLLTANDLALIPVATARRNPIRLLDTRTAAKRVGIVQKSSPTAIDSTGRLTANSWIDVLVDTAGSYFELTGLFLNLAVIGPVANGYSTVYPSGVRPDVSTINFRAAVSLSNAAFVAPGIYDGNFVVRVHSSQTTHILLDLSGTVVSDSGQPAATTSAAGSDAKRRVVRQTKRATALKAKLARSAA